MQIGGGFQVSRCSLSHTGAVSHQQFDKFNWARKAFLQDDESKEKAGSASSTLIPVRGPSTIAPRLVPAFTAGEVASTSRFSPDRFKFRKNGFENFECGSLPVDDWYEAKLVLSAPFQRNSAEPFAV